MKWTIQFETEAGDSAKEFHEAFAALMDRFPNVQAVTTHEEEKDDFQDSSCFHT